MSNYMYVDLTVVVVARYLLLYIRANLKRDANESRLEGIGRSGDGNWFE